MPEPSAKVAHRPAPVPARHPLTLRASLPLRPPRLPQPDSLTKGNRLQRPTVLRLPCPNPALLLPRLPRQPPALSSQAAPPLSPAALPASPPAPPFSLAPPRPPSQPPAPPRRPPTAPPRAPSPPPERPQERRRRRSSSRCADEPRPFLKTLSLDKEKNNDKKKTKIISYSLKYFLYFNFYE